MSDLGPLREWWKEWGEFQSVDIEKTGLTPALKAAGVITEPDVEKALAWVNSPCRDHVTRELGVACSGIPCICGRDDARRIIERARGWADAMEFLANLLHDLEAARGHVGGGWGSQLQKREVELRQIIERAREAR